LIYLYSDYITSAGGIETYLHALAIKLLEEKFSFRIAVAEVAYCELLDELEAKGAEVHRQGRVRGDRWLMRQRVLMHWLKKRLAPGDWVYCVRQPMPGLYLKLVRLVHARGARIAASWMLAPEFVNVPTKYKTKFQTAVSETDVVISVSRCTLHQFQTRYGYQGPVEVVRYHNLPVVPEALPVPPGPPWRIAYMGRLSIEHKNLDVLLRAIAQVAHSDPDVELHLYGEGGAEAELKSLAVSLGIANVVHFHGRYDHRFDVPAIAGANHIFVYASKFEGGPCFTLLELLQAGRFVVASTVGGIPDIYEGRERIGCLVKPNDEGDLIQALQNGVDRIKSGEILAEEVRSRYFEDLDMDAAHSAWTRALSLSQNVQ
jgi:glycosyltransferase involved in cell wall biosynthesis